MQIQFLEDSTVVYFAIFLNEGKQTLISDYKIVGNTVFSTEEIKTKFATTIGTPLQQNILEKDIDELLKHYENKGYPFTKIKIDSLQIDTSQLQLSFIIEIEEGKQVSISEIQVTGNTITNTNVITREAKLLPNQIYQEEKIVRIQKNIERLQLFSSVSNPELYLLDTISTDTIMKGGLKITVQEMNTNNFDGIIGYIPNAKGGGSFTGSVNVALRNLFGTGRKLFFRWNREAELTQELEGKYYEPWIFNFPVNVGGTFFQRKQDSSFVKTTVDIKGDFSFFDELVFGITLGNESIYSSSELSRLVTFNSTTFFYGGEVRYDTRDNIINSISGIYYSMSYQQGSKKITGPEKYLSLISQTQYTIQKFFVEANIFFPLWERQVFAMGFQGKLVNATQVEQSDLFPFGGTNSLRGYRENQFYASQTAVLKNEYRIVIGKNSSVFGFFDVGYFFRPNNTIQNIIEQKEFLYGYGIGARVETNLGIISVSYALGKDDAITQGKIHFGLANNF